jgi:hypothetical protein
VEVAQGHAGLATVAFTLWAIGATAISSASRDTSMAPADLGNTPGYWIRPTQVLSAAPGFHRFVWDLHYAPVPGIKPEYPIGAIYKNTAPASTSPWAMPGKYTVVLTIGGKSYRQPLSLLMDPRVKTSNADLAGQFKLSKQLYDEWLALNSISESLRFIRSQIAELRSRVPAGDLKTHIDALGEKLQSLAGAGGGGPGGGGGPVGAATRITIATTTGRLRTLFNLTEDVDLAPTPQVAAASVDVVKDSRSLQNSWQTMKSQDIPALNQELRAAGLPLVEISK